MNKDKVYNNPFYKNILESEEKLLIDYLSKLCETTYEFNKDLIKERKYLFIGR